MVVRSSCNFCDVCIMFGPLLVAGRPDTPLFCMWGLPPSGPNWPSARRRRQLVGNAGRCRKVPEGAGRCRKVPE
eukprot:12608404-Alexandrium_andersonii.AAC.1